MSPSSEGITIPFLLVKMLLSFPGVLTIVLLLNAILQARTEFTPRAYPSSTNLRTIMPPEMLEYMDTADGIAYQGRDVFNPVLHPPEGEVDVLSIVEAGVDFKPVMLPDYSSFYKIPSNSKPPFDTIGRGNKLATVAGDDYCDGTVDSSSCNRSRNNSCLLSGHNDNRNGIMYHAYSGWLFFNIPDLKYGYIVAKIETWHWEGSKSKKAGPCWYNCGLLFNSSFVVSWNCGYLGQNEW